ncbi:MAG: hypothetical protein LBL44_08175 [Treponema sp.]|jgi:hypothetical protein|nr:hypothetical protein [Treponema sp.]
MSGIKSWEDVAQLPRTVYQCGSPSDAAGLLTGKIYEEPLLVQSNARILIGHSVNGMFRFSAFPSKVYPVPINNRDFGYCQGMNHHTDNALYLGDLRYSLIMNGKTISLADCLRKAETRYASHFLPVTRTTEGDLDISIISCAPVSEKGNPALRNAPLPGPAGAIYALVIKNMSGKKSEGTLRLSASKSLIGDYEDLKPEYRDMNAAAFAIRRGTLMLSRPEGSAGVHLQGGHCSFLGDSFISELDFSIPAGETRVFCTYIAMGSDFCTVTSELYGLLRKDPLDWISRTVQFWRERLPAVEPAAEDSGDIPARMHEFFIRCLLDNFNCLQTDANGNLLAHRQGAPSHGFGTIWGIDYEPTIVSAAILCPEIAERALVFLLDKTRPMSSYCKPDHSVPILCSPVVIAAFLLRRSGDTGMFTRTPGMLDALIGIMEEITGFKHHEETLFSTYWSSDGLTGRRYDYGTNVKLYYAFKGIAYILESLGKNGKKYSDIAEGITVSIEKTMLIDGPFGKMLSGGTNLDTDDEGLYIKDNNVPYYDGEDTSSMLAPVYGACADDYAPWVHYQRFGRSLFCENYQPEMDLRSWYASAPLANDGTAVLASVSGAVSRGEMADTAATAVNYIDRVTGSLFWWPSGPEECRKLTRCSQGQGAWAWQYESRWLGIEADAVSRTLTFSPKGLPDKLHIHPAGIFGLPFEIDYDEGAGTCLIKNLAAETWNVRVGFRKKGCGAEGKHETVKQAAAPGETLMFRRGEISAGIDGFSAKDIHAAELAALAEDGILFMRTGGLWYWLQNETPPFDLRFVIGNNTDTGWKEVKVVLEMPLNCSASVREQGAMKLENEERRVNGRAVCFAGPLKNGERKTASFVFHMPYARRVDRKNEDLCRHLLPKPLSCDALIEVVDIEKPELVTLNARLEIVTEKNGNMERTLAFKAGYIPKRKQ